MVIYVILQTTVSITSKVSDVLAEKLAISYDDDKQHDTPAVTVPFLYLIALQVFSCWVYLSSKMLVLICSVDSSFPTSLLPILGGKRAVDIN